MIVKLIRASVPPAKREAFLAEQRRWNEAMAQQPGFLGCWVATDPDDPERVYISIRMRSREDLDRFMAGEHDEIERRTSMRDLYDALDVKILDVEAAEELPA